MFEKKYTFIISLWFTFLYRAEQAEDLGILWKLGVSWFVMIVHITLVSTYKYGLFLCGLS